VIAVDAIDESTEPRAMCALLNTLGALGCRVLAGCREHLLDSLSDSDAVRLDQAPYLHVTDIDLYVAAILQEHDPDARTDTGLIAEISEAAHGNFLVAQLVARAVTLSGQVVRPLPRDVAQAFDGLLDALPDPRLTRELLLALAYAKGDGLPTELWRNAASALSRPCQRADIHELLRGPAASFLITRLEDPGGARHRLFMRRSRRRSRARATRSATTRSCGTRGARRSPTTPRDGNALPPTCWYTAPSTPPTAGHCTCWRPT
jgi:hypothetical protein